MGFHEVYNLKGGIMKWNAAGMPLEGADATQGISLNDFNALVIKQPLVLVDFNATWCAPCKELKPILDKIVEERKGKLTFVSLDADQNKNLLQEKKIDGIPYLELYKEGKLVWSHKGLISSDNFLKETGI
jgi:thioredoxin-like negative regulator of GroEL